MTCIPGWQVADLSTREKELLAALRHIATTSESRDYMRGVALEAIRQAEEAPIAAGTGYSPEERVRI